MNPKKPRTPCFPCGKEPQQFGQVFCSIKCQSGAAYVQWIGGWLRRWIDGSTVTGASKHIKRYLIDRDGNWCSKCGWAEVNEKTGRVPVQLDHEDGDATNNHPSNVRLLCPNCHALTPTFCGLNRGNGRAWRRDRYNPVTLKETTMRALLLAAAILALTVSTAQAVGSAQAPAPPTTLTIACPAPGMPTMDDFTKGAWTIVDVSRLAMRSAANPDEPVVGFAVRYNNGGASILIVWYGQTPVYFDAAPDDRTTKPLLNRQHVTDENTLRDTPEGPCRWDTGAPAKGETT